MPDKINVLCVGDVVGRVGRQSLTRFLPEIQKSHNIDLTIVNVENSAGGFGVSLAVYQELANLKIDVMTSGNHIFDKKEILTAMPQMSKLIRPLNFPAGTPGVGIREVILGDMSVTVINLIGRVFMGLYDCPFQKITQLLEQLQAKKTLIIVDMHAETTSEKIAMGHYLDGKIALQFGTHTHVMTADNTILPNGTGYITDIGMTGPQHTVIGMKKEEVINRFLTSIHHRLEVPKKGPYQFNAICATIDCHSGKTLGIERIIL